jgi:tetratricopeptide (TPR) repeat protein
LVLSVETQMSAAWTARRWSGVAALALALSVGGWCNAINLDAVRADIAYNLAQVQNLDYAIGLDKYAMDRAPLEDVYYRGLGITLAGKAQLADATNPVSRLDERTSFDAVRQFTVPQLVALNRNELFFAARAALLRARELNPLNPDHTVALAQMYQQWAMLAPADARPALVEQASRFYAHAISQRPRDARLLNESALFDLTYKRDTDAALQKLGESLRIDPRITQTYWNLGQAYAARNDFAKAIAMYQKYIELAPDAANVWEAHKNLALLYKQMGDLANAVVQAQTATSLAPEEVQSQLQTLVEQLRAQAAPQ